MGVWQSMPYGGVVGHGLFVAVARIVFLTVNNNQHNERRP